MKVSIIIPTHKRHQDVLELLGSIRNQQMDRNHYEVLLVPNIRDLFYESEGFQTQFEDLPLKVTAPGRIGVNRARNHGLIQSKAPVSLLLDDDCMLLESDYLEKIVKCHDNNPEAVAIGGTYLVEPEKDSIDLAYNVVARYWQALEGFGDYRSSRLVGGNVSYKTQKLIDMDQLFNEDILFGGTEAEFHHRLNKLGLETLYFSSLKVLHRTELSVRDLLSKSYNQALATTRFDIDSGFKGERQRSYHTSKYIWAKQLSKTEEKFHEVILFMDLYDWAYQRTCENPKIKERHLVKEAKKWIRGYGQDFARESF